MTGKLAGKVALVTGGSAGIGLGMPNVLPKKALKYLLSGAVAHNSMKQSR